MVEKAEPMLAAAVGVWGGKGKKEEGRKESEIRFMLYRRYGWRCGAGPSSWS
jgi:hypothetical protein